MNYFPALVVASIAPVGRTISLGARLRFVPGPVFETAHSAANSAEPELVVATDAAAVVAAAAEQLHVLHQASVAR